jgi:hypothetical protein
MKPAFYPLAALIANANDENATTRGRCLRASPSFRSHSRLCLNGSRRIIGRARREKSGRQAGSASTRGRRDMSSLNLGIEIRDFDLERMGFSLSVLDESKKRQASEAYLRMTLLELHAFLNALRAAEGEVELTTYDSNGVNKLPPLKGLAGREVEPAERRDKRVAAE